MDYVNLFQGIALVILAAQGLFLQYRLNKVIDLSIQQGQAMLAAVYKLEGKIQEND